MKRILYLLPMLAALLVGCSGSDGEEEGANFALEKNSVSVTYKNEAVVKVSGVDPTDCSVKSDDDFIADAFMNSDGVKILTYHVGKTTLKVTYGTKTEELTVNVLGVSKNYIGNPVLDFGASKSEIEKQITSKGGSVSTSGTNLYEKEYNDEVEWTHSHTYKFDNDKLVYVFSMPGGVFSSGSKSPFWSAISERYRAVAIDGDYWWYQHTGKFMVRVTDGSQKGEIILEYGATKNDILEYTAR